MKKVLLAITFLATLNFAQAQNAIPNPGFEIWNANPNYDDPADWGTINGLTYFLGARTVTKATLAADVHGGSAAIKLESLNIPFQGNAPGIAATGTINTSGYIDGGVAYNKRPIALTGWYKYTVTGTDTGSIEATLSKWNSNTHVREEVGHAQFTKNATVGSYTQFTVNFTYSSSNIPDTLVVILLTSTRTTGFPLGSKLWVDDLDLVMCSGYTATPSSTIATCTSATGSASVVTANGTLASTYLWSNASTSASLTNIVAGTYTVTATDFNGCTATASAVVGASAVNIGASASSTNTICTASLGAAETGTTAGSSPFTYLWSNSATTHNLANVAAGSYTVTITDVNGCTGTASTTVSATITPINVTATSTSSLCGSNTGTAIAATADGTAPYSYAWANSAVNNDTITALGAGNYTVVVTDANGCSGTATTTVTTPNGPSATSAATGVSCFGGSNGAIDVTVNGGTAPLVYAWSNSASTEDLQNIAAGSNYTLTITDDNGCSFVVSVDITEPTQLTVLASHSNVSCNSATDGSIGLSLAGGVSPYTFDWGSGITLDNRTNLAAGNYSVTVTDANTCSLTTTVTITEPAVLSATITVTNASSASAHDGSIVLNTSGGTAPYTYNWSSGNGTALAPGVYCYTITDNNNCTVSSCDTVSAPSAIGNIFAEKVKLYPNPTNNQVTIETNSANGKFNFTVYSLEGKLVEENTFNGGKVVVDVKHLAAGFYSYQLKEVLSGEMKVGKLAIER